MLPADSHVHSEWSWDAPFGSMERTCARAVEVGLPAVAFTEHADWAPWEPVPSSPYFDRFVRDGLVRPPDFDLRGFLASVERCRSLFPGLRIISGVELGEAHRHPDAVAALLAAGGFGRTLGSVHTLGTLAVETLYDTHTPAETLRLYLAEVLELVTRSDAFEVLAHIDYVLRFWPAGERFDIGEFEASFRAVLSELAAQGRILEINTKVPLSSEVLDWWRDCGGRAVTFASDAHEPEGVAAGFAEAAAMASARGFRAGRHPYDVWFR